MNKYTLSIIVCLYNSENYIQNLYNNFAKLDQDKIQIVLINDGSIDNTKIRLKKFDKNKNIEIIHQTNKGLASARNNAFRYCKSDWIALMDHDDNLTIEKIDFCNSFERFLKTNKNYMYFGNAFLSSKYKQKSLKFKKNHFLENKINLSKNSAFFNLLIHGCFIVSSTFIFNKKIYDEINGFDDSLFFTCDYDFFIRASKKFDFGYIDEPHCEWIEHENQATNRLRHQHYKELVFLYLREIKKINNFNSDLILIYVKFFKYLIKLTYLFFKNYANRFKI